MVLTLQCDVGAGKSRTGDAEPVTDQACESLDIGSIDLNTLDGGDSSCSGEDSLVSYQVLEDSVKELVSVSVLASGICVFGGLT
jgi:hypothetical protein